MRHSSTYNISVRAHLYGNAAKITVHVPPEKPILTGSFNVNNDALSNTSFAAIIPPVKPETKSAKR